MIMITNAELFLHFFGSVAVSMAHEGWQLQQQQEQHQQLA
jgi:hypothetical protein